MRKVMMTTVAAIIAMIFSVPVFGAEISVDGRMLNGEFINIDGSMYMPSSLAADIFPVYCGEVDVDGETYVPVRLNCELSGFGIEWNAETNTAEITTSVEQFKGPAIESVRETAGYLLLDEKTRERFESYAFESRGFTEEIYAKVAERLENENYNSKTPDEQASILIGCLKIYPYILVDIDSVSDLSGGVTVEVGSKTYFPSYDVWDGNKEPVWGYDVTMSDGYKLGVFTTLEDCSVVENASKALARFPLAVRRHLRRIVHRVDAANNYNGDENTIWIRLDHIPKEDAIACTLAHELGHVLDRSLTLDESVWDRATEADVVPVSTYGSGNRDEDLAEFCRLYFMTLGNPSAAEAVAKVYPNRMAALKALLYAADNEYYKEFASEYIELFPYDEAEPIYSIISPKNSRMVLTVQSMTGASGESLILAQNMGSDNQLWWLRRRIDGGVTLFNKATGYCVSVPGGSMQGGIPLLIWNSMGRTNETWTVTETADGSLTFRARHSEQYMGFNGTTVVQTPVETRWIVIPVNE
ncbi:MAG: RICIN domain-containing protein [Oscillospiraceae bacterium]|nr:RICIN domain-containing protein [Oscillospiraceae bacterium]